MYRLKQIIENAGSNRKIGAIEVVDGVIYLHTEEAEYKHENHNWYQLCSDSWVNLQGGVPIYESEILLDEILFETDDEVFNEQTV